MQPEPGSLQFQRAEFADSQRSCAHCKSGIADRYFLLGGHTLCTTCAPLISHAATPQEMGRPLLYGFAAAIAGAIGYALITNLLQARLSLVSILVGLLVGKAVRAGAGGLGGRKLQVMAVLLTYVSITLSVIPQLVQGVEGTRFVFAIGIALAAPFLEIASSPGGGLLNALIIFFGLAQAWRMTRGVSAVLTGPFQAGAPA
jgi:hypothetical protein